MQTHAHLQPRIAREPVVQDTHDEERRSSPAFWVWAGLLALYFIFRALNDSSSHFDTPDYNMDLPKLEADIERLRQNMKASDSEYHRRLKSLQDSPNAEDLDLENLKRLIEKAKADSKAGKYQQPTFPQQEMPGKGSELFQPNPRTGFPLK